MRSALLAALAVLLLPSPAFATGRSSPWIAAPAASSSRRRRASTATISFFPACAMAGHVRGKGVCTGLFKRPQ